MEKTREKAIKLISFNELSRLFGFSRNAITRNNIPKAHEEKINDLLELIEDWIEKNNL